MFLLRVDAEARVDVELVNDGLAVSIARVVTLCLVCIDCLLRENPGGFG